jgi:hypothetical protein
MAFTVQNIVDEALRLIKVLRANASFTTGSAEYQTCVDALNQVVDAFNADGTSIYQIVRESLSLTGAATYTIGTGATFNTVRPEKIRAASIFVSNNAQQKVEIVSAEKFTALADRVRTGLFADMLFYDAAYPNGNISLWPIPLTGATLDLLSLKPVALFVAITDTVAFPPGYLEALKYALAVAIEPEFPDAVMNPAIVARAAATRASLATLNEVAIGGAMPPLGAIRPPAPPPG